MRRLPTAPTTYSVSDLIGWQRQKELELKPKFQRRSVWSEGAKSYFIDTLVRGLPVPLLFVRERINVRKQTQSHDVVDGQQRLRTIFAFVDEKLLKDFDPESDRFTIKRAHNPDLAGRRFRELDAEVQSHILSYRLGVEVLPPQTEDRDVLEIFARLNATGTKLNPQELRNAAFFGTSMRCSQLSPKSYS